MLAKVQAIAMPNVEDKSWMRGVSLGAEFGGPDVSVGSSVQALRGLLAKHCRGPYSEEVLGFALVLRIDGSIKQYRPVGVDRIRRNKRNKYIGADVCIADSEWRDISEPQFSRHLAGSVRTALETCLVHLTKQKVQIDGDRLLHDYERVEAEFLGQYAAE
jgi:hypothetical protein